jgi:hypothetical protein
MARALFRLGIGADDFVGGEIAHFHGYMGIDVLKSPLPADGLQIVDAVDPVEYGFQLFLITQ